MPESALPSTVHPGDLLEYTATDAEYQLKKAIQQAKKPIQQAKKPDADKNSILSFLDKGKTLMEGVKSASGLVLGIGDAVEKVGELF